MDNASLATLTGLSAISAIWQKVHEPSYELAKLAIMGLLWLAFVGGLVWHYTDESGDWCPYSPPIKRRYRCAPLGARFRNFEATQRSDTACRC